MASTNYNPKQFRHDTYDVGSKDAALKMLRVCLNLLGTPSTLSKSDLLKAIRAAEEEHERATK
jgi:hypothetical protein